MSTKHTWHKGPPPFVGWWKTKWERTDGINWRWWNGELWSKCALYDDYILTVMDKANKPSNFLPDEILWSDYWPENARVPRIDPRMI